MWFSPTYYVLYMYYKQHQLLIELMWGYFFIFKVAFHILSAFPAWLGYNKTGIYPEDMYIYMQCAATDSIKSLDTLFSPRKLEYSQGFAWHFCTLVKPEIAIRAWWSEAQHRSCVLARGTHCKLVPSLSRHRRYYPIKNQYGMDWSCLTKNRTYKKRNIYLLVCRLDEPSMFIFH